MNNFKLLTNQELINYCKKLNWTRKFSELHIHHTYIPSHKDYNGKNGIQIQENMKNYHVNTNGWTDIGQHLTLLPDGLWVTGRDFNHDPASIYGRNKYGFAIEILGNFDKNNDKLEGKQLQSIVEFLSFSLDYFKLDYSNIVFHREYDRKSCPGTGIDKSWFVEQVKKYRANNDQKTISVVENSIIIKYNNQTINADNFIYKGTTYVPLRFLSENFGKIVNWDEKNRIINIKDVK